MSRDSRTLSLRERQPRECRLSRADVDLLLADHRPHVEVVPTHRRGRYRLTPTGAVSAVRLLTARRPDTRHRPQRPTEPGLTFTGWLSSLLAGGAR